MFAKRTLLSAVLAFALVHCGVCSNRNRRQNAGGPKKNEGGSDDGGERQEPDRAEAVSPELQTTIERLQKLEKDVWEVTPWEPFFDWKANAVIEENAKAVKQKLEPAVRDMVQAEIQNKVQALIADTVKQALAVHTGPLQDKLFALNTRLDNLEPSVNEAVNKQNEDTRNGAAVASGEFEAIQRQLAELESSAARQDAAAELQAMLEESATRVDTNTRQLTERLDGVCKTHECNAESVAQMREQLAAACDKQKCYTEECAARNSECQRRADEIAEAIAVRHRETQTAAHASDSLLDALKVRMEELTQSTNVLQRDLGLQSFGKQLVPLTMPRHPNAMYHMRPAELASKLKTAGGGNLGLSDETILRYAAEGTALAKVVFNTDMNLNILQPICKQWLLDKFIMDPVYATCEVSPDTYRLVLAFTNEVVTQPNGFSMEFANA